METRIVDLVYFAERKQFAETRYGIDDANVACRESLLQGRTYEEVAHEHSYVVVPDAVDGREAATAVGIVYHVVVYQRGVVKHLHRRACLYDVVIDASEEACRQEHEYGADLLPFCLKIALDYLVHKRIG